MTVPLLTGSEILVGLEAYAVIHATVWLGFKLVRVIGYTLYKMVVRNRYLEIVFAHEYAKHKKIGHFGSYMTCTSEQCPTINFIDIT